MSTQAQSEGTIPSPSTDFFNRHLGSDETKIRTMLAVVEADSLDQLMSETVPETIRVRYPLRFSKPRSEQKALEDLRALASRNQLFRSFIGMGYSESFVPPVILRNIVENPGWYTAYTPYQAEISQGRLEALLNFQTMISDLTGMEIANASLLDEATAAAEAMHMAQALCDDLKKDVFFISSDCHPQTVDVVMRRAEPLGITVRVGDYRTFDFSVPVFGALLQYPASDGGIENYEPFIERLHRNGALAVVAADLMSLVLLRSPGEFGADVVVGSAQRFGIPLGYGGPHAAFMATRDSFKRVMPGRLIGVSKDAQGNPGMRLSLQTREQHIRRDKATSNICTAQVLLAVLASMYAVYHGPEGLKRIALRIHLMTAILAEGLQGLGFRLSDRPFFDTLRIEVGEKKRAILDAARFLRINLREIGETTLGITLGETTTTQDLTDLLTAFAGETVTPIQENVLTQSVLSNPSPFTRKKPFLTHPVFNSHHTETEMMRYIRRLEAKDLSLTTSMIPLGSCTMKLNAAAEMLPITWPEFSRLHPFVPLEQAQGYQLMVKQLEEWLAEITGLVGVSLQPNAGSQGEYAGLLAIRDYHRSHGQGHRDVCLIPVSAHGTNPASAVMAGFKVVPVACDDKGNIAMEDLKAKAMAHHNHLAAIMVTYPSTHGVFEESIREVCEMIHRSGGQVYMDGANMNAQVGLCRPGDIGADVCHLNLHKTFSIPHGGGGPGIGPVCAARHLVPYLPSHSVVPSGGSAKAGAVCAAPWGSAGVLPISWMYIAMMGGEGLTQATKLAILNANYIARRLESFYPILYVGKNGRVAHECIIDFREWKARAGIEVEDVAKRLMDYGFHAPTMSWPVPGTLMVEPTESESKEELDRFCDALISIHSEMEAIESGQMDRKNNPLKNAPHTAAVVTSDMWDRPYTRAQAAYPAPWLKNHKYWPAAGRIDNVYGDRNLICSCRNHSLVE